MKSSNAVLLAVAATAAAQPRGHQHAHLHPARNGHEHLHNKRVMETELVIEWVTETVTEYTDSTTTEWITPSVPTFTPTTLSTVSASTTTAKSSAGQFFEGASIDPVVTPSSVYVAPVVVAPEPTTTTTPVYVAPVVVAPEPTTTTTPVYVAPVVVAPEPTTTTTPVYVAPVVVAPTPTAEAVAPVASTSEDSSVTVGSGTTFEGKITYIGDTTGAYGSCGEIYTPGSMFVAVNPGILSCFAPMWITANGRTVKAYAADKCMGCDKTHIDVAEDVYNALGYNYDDPTDGGMHNNAGLTWTISEVAS